MRRLWIVFLIVVVLAAPAASASGPRVTRAALAAVERTIDARLASIVPDNPYTVLGMTRGVYLEGYGVVFSTEVNLLPGGGPTPFYPRLSPQQMANSRSIKLERMELLRSLMREAMVEAATALDMLSSGDKIVLSISLFHHSWENTEGMPGQIVMLAERKSLLSLRPAGLDLSRAATLIQVREY